MVYSNYSNYSNYSYNPLTIVTIVIPQFLSTSLGEKNWAEMRGASFLPQLAFGAIQQTLGLARCFWACCPWVEFWYPDKAS